MFKLKAIVQCRVPSACVSDTTPDRTQNTQDSRLKDTAVWLGYDPWTPWRDGDMQKTEEAI